MTSHYRLTYDTTMAGLLTAIFAVYEARLESAVIVKEDTAADFFSLPIVVETDAVKARRVWKGLGDRVGKEGQQQFYQCFLSEEEGMENTLLDYARYIFSGAENAALNFGHPAVLAVAQTARRVWREKHRMEAFVRFQQLRDGLYYAAISPDFNVLPLIRPHFKSRYADQDWLIYDLRRRYGIHYTRESGTVSEVSMTWGDAVTDGQPDAAVCGEREALYQALWKDYFKHTGIPARKNPALHLRHIPKRYWRFLPEKDPF